MIKYDQDNTRQSAAVDAYSPASSMSPFLYSCSTVVPCRSCALTHGQDLKTLVQADVLNESDDLQCS